MADDTQRQTALKLKLGSEQLELVRLDASEAMSQHFMISLDILSKLGEIDLLPHLGKPAEVESLLDGEHLRYFHGIVTDGYYVDFIEGTGHIYRLTLHPTAYFHDRGLNFRIFQEESVKDIITKVLDERKIDFEFNANGGLRMRSYCVQYGESDFSFISRMMEEDGLYYFYRHEEGKHIMVICDAPGQHIPLAVANLEYNPNTYSVTNTDSAARAVATHSGIFIQSWHEHVSTGAEAKVTMRDYDFIAPNRVREAVATDQEIHAEDSIEYYNWPTRAYQESNHDWPARSDLDKDGKNLAKVLLESLRAQRVRYEGSSGFAGLVTGETFELDMHPVDRLNKEYMIIQCRTGLANENFRTSMDPGETLVHFCAIPADTQFRAPIVTRRPVARGPESAIVTGPAGEEIHVDKYGRIKVHFYWDRVGKMDDTCSCWIRVSQTGALGNIINPRVGDEVLIDFVNGNPDRPIMIGRVYNEGNMPTYALPDNKTRSVWRTKTYKRTSGVGYGEAIGLDTKQPGVNELRFEDKTGEEELFIHAEKDMNTRVRRYETHHVGGDQTINIGYHRVEEVGKNETIKIGVDRTEEVGSNEKITIGANRDVRIKSDYNLKTDGSQTDVIGNELSITAGSKITLKVGASSLTMDGGSITLQSPQIKINGSATVAILSAKTDVTGSGMVKVVGGVVMIN